VFTAGDHVSRDFFATFQDTVRSDNQKVLQDRQNAQIARGVMIPRENQRRLRQIAAPAVSNGWLKNNQKEDDAAIYEIWKGVATGALVARSPEFSPENLSVIRQNWQILSATSPKFDARKLPNQPLLSLLPQGTLSNPSYLPAPHEVLLSGFYYFTTPGDSGQMSLPERLLISVRIVFTGFFLSCLVGVPIGILCGTYCFFSKVGEPFIDFFRYLPAPAFSTLLVAIFGAHDEPKIALVFIGTFFQMVLIVSKTTRQLDQSLLEAAQTLGARPVQLFTHVVIPGILPNLYNDMRILLGWSWTWLVIAELIGVKTGLTEFIETQGRWRNFDAVFPVIFLIGIIGFFTDQFLAWFRGILFPYTKKSRSRPRKKTQTPPQSGEFAADPGVHLSEATTR
jgi:NitT/TauT family transport system permease protein